MFLTALGGVEGIKQLLRYWRTRKADSRSAQAAADTATAEARHKGLDLMQDQYDYVLTKLSVLQEEYITLQERVRNDAMEHTNTINTKCNEIAALKSKIVYYKGLRCYMSDCGQRVLINPDNTEDKGHATRKKGTG